MDNSYIILEKDDKKFAELELQIKTNNNEIITLNNTIKCLTDQLQQNNSIITELKKQVNDLEKKLNDLYKNSSYDSPSWVDINRLSISDAEKINYMRKRNSAIRQNIAEKFLPDKSF